MCQEFGTRQPNGQGRCHVKERDESFTRNGVRVVAWKDVGA